MVSISRRKEGKFSVWFTMVLSFGRINSADAKKKHSAFLTQQQIFLFSKSIEATRWPLIDSKR